MSMSGFILTHIFHSDVFNLSMTTRWRFFFVQKCLAFSRTLFYHFLLLPNFTWSVCGETEKVRTKRSWWYVCCPFHTQRSWYHVIFILAWLKHISSLYEGKRRHGPDTLLNITNRPKGLHMIVWYVYLPINNQWSPSKNQSTLWSFDFLQIIKFWIQNISSSLVCLLRRPSRDNLSLKNILLFWPIKEIQAMFYFRIHNFFFSIALSCRINEYLVGVFGRTRYTGYTSSVSFL